MAPFSLKETIANIAKDFPLSAVWLFGSAIEDADAATDIDLAVEGLAPENLPVSEKSKELTEPPR